MSQNKSKLKSPRLENKTEGFSIIAEPLRSDYTLNQTERAIMWTLLTASPTFKPTKRGLAKIIQVSEPTIQKGMKSLQERGYLIIKNPSTKNAVWEVYQKPNYEVKKHPYEALKDNAIAIMQAQRTGLFDELIKEGYLSREERQALFKSVCELAKLKWIDED